ncbi:MAG TPA: 3'(2'),5'-bisphosphate nucleotidase CysQ, partial [Moraxellaceae bacterium]|nr:3'(2'),5'-bisphosphate nucleotidase CysQ [Moraxellaceae bacterium]
ISEESDAIPRDTRLQWPRCWMVDPLDGTREFISRSGEFTVNIALIDQGEAVLGVVHAPALGIVYAAARGCGAWRAEGATTRPVLSSPLPAKGERAVRIVASRRHRGERDEAFCAAVSARMGDVDFSTAGSAFKICVVAEGRADVYPRFGPTMEWDTAAGQVVLDEAGGILMDERGRPFRYNERKTLLNGSFIAAGAEPGLWQSICATLPAESGKPE